MHMHHNSYHNLPRLCPLPLFSVLTVRRGGQFLCPTPPSTPLQTSPRSFSLCISLSHLGSFISSSLSQVFFPTFSQFLLSFHPTLSGNSTPQHTAVTLTRQSEGRKLKEVIPPDRHLQQTGLSVQNIMLLKVTTIVYYLVKSWKVHVKDPETLVKG